MNTLIKNLVDICADLSQAFFDAIKDAVDAFDRFADEVTKD